MKSKHGENRRQMLAAAHRLAGLALTDANRYVITPIGSDGLAIDDYKVRLLELPDFFVDNPSCVPKLLELIAENAFEEHHASTIAEALQDVRMIVVHDRTFDDEGDRYWIVSDDVLAGCLTWLTTEVKPAGIKTDDEGFPLDVSSTPNAGDLQSPPVDQVRKEIKQSDELRQYREKARKQAELAYCETLPVSDIRPAVLEFAGHMERRLRMHDPSKGDWTEMELDAIAHAAGENLQKALSPAFPGDIGAVRSTIDAANYAMFMFHKLLQATRPNRGKDPIGPAGPSEIEDLRAVLKQAGIERDASGRWMAKFFRHEGCSILEDMLPLEEWLKRRKAAAVELAGVDSPSDDREILKQFEQGMFDREHDNPSAAEKLRDGSAHGEALSTWYIRGFDYARLLKGG